MNHLCTQKYETCTPNTLRRNNWNQPARSLFVSFFTWIDAGHGSRQLGGPVLYGDNISIRHASAEVEGCHWVFSMFSVLGEAPCQGAACKSICAFLLSDFFIHFLSDILFSILVADVCMGSYKCALRWDPSSPIECLNRSLKTIVLQSYGGRRTHVEFAKFFIKRARVLELMKFCFIGADTTRWHQKQHRQLNINSTALRRTKFLFVRQCDSPSRFWMDKCFSRKDPFKETMWLVIVSVSLCSIFPFFVESVCQCVFQLNWRDNDRYLFLEEISGLSPSIPN